MCCMSIWMPEGRRHPAVPPLLANVHSCLTAAPNPFAEEGDSRDSVEQ
jgi:hypothetical protein